MDLEIFERIERGFVAFEPAAVSGSWAAVVVADAAELSDSKRNFVSFHLPMESSCAPSLEHIPQPKSHLPSPVVAVPASS